jgi:hypothetical protein
VSDQLALTDADRMESLKGAVVAGFAAGGVATALLLAHRVAAVGWGGAIQTLTAGLLGSSFWISAAIAGLSGGLFGITYRYAVRQETNLQLKAGVVLAFSLVRGLALVNGAAAICAWGWPWAVAIAENLLIFGSAALSLELVRQWGWVKPQS